MIDEFGNVAVNNEYAADDRLVQMSENSWQGTEIIDTIRIVDFENERFLKKEGNSLWASNDISGRATEQPLSERAGVLVGFLEMSNVNAVSEMVNMIEVQRAYELNSKVIQTEDTLIGKAVTEVGRVGNN